MMTLADLETPFLTVDLDVVERNIARMQRYCDTHDLALRPHAKTHKLPLIAGLQLEAGACGITCQKLGEAEVMRDAGCTDILVAFPLVGLGKAERFAELARGCRISVAADSAAVARPLSAALSAAGSSAGFLVDCDTGFHRTGVQTPRQAAELAVLADDLPGFDFRGLMTHPTLPESGSWLREAQRLVEECGLEVPCVSVGGTAGAFATHEVSEVTELRVGTYVYGDRACIAGGVASLEDCALRVLATVVSRPTQARAIVDSGSKTLTSDQARGTASGMFGLIVEYPDAVLYQLSEEHGHVDVSACKAAPEVGEVVTIVPNHACGAVNLHSEVALHRSGRGPVELLPVAARGRIR